MTKEHCVDHPLCREDLIKRINLRIATRTFISGLAIVVVLLGTVSTIWYRSYSNAQEKQTTAINKNRESVNNIYNDTTIIKNEQTHISEKMQNLGVKFNTIEKNQQKVLQELIKLNTKLEK